VVGFMPWPLYPGVGDPNTHWTGGWVGPRASPDVVVKRKTPIFDIARNSTLVIKHVCK